jgi:thioredoxin:protein disulfide reductase
MAKRWIACLLLPLFFALGVAAQTDMAGPTVTFEAVTESSAVLAGESLRAVLTFHISEGWHVNAHKPLDEFLIPTVLTFDESPGLRVASIVYPDHKMYTFDFSPDPLAVYEETFSIGIVIETAADLPAREYTLPGTLRYQGCNDRMCAPPKDIPVEVALTVASPGQTVTPEDKAIFRQVDWAAGTLPPLPPRPDAESETPAGDGESGDWPALAVQFRETGRLAGFANTAGFLSFLDSAESGEAPVDALTGHSIWLVLLIVLAGGFLLNLTPCVLPLIPINVAIIGAGARAGSRGRGFALGLAYGAGISLVYGALGLVVALGISSAFGAINSTPWFNGAIALLFIVLGLAMFDVINLDFSKFQAKFGIRKNENGSFFIAFGMGSISALLAGACVAPVVISTILYAQDRYSQGQPLALMLPFLLGAGMALPWPFMGMGLSFLPKPGMWMVRLKQAFGVSIIAFALYYGYEAYRLISPVKYEAAEGWETSIETGLARARAENKPVLIDFWATWCKNCIVMSNTVLKDPDVIDRLEDYVKIKYQAEELTRSPVKEVAEYFEVMGLPTFIVLEPKGP